MKRLAAIFLIACFGASPSAPRYPSPPTDATVDVYYGTSVPDPYRPLEDVDAPATRAWVEAEASLTRSYIDAIPERAAIRAHLQSIVNYERYGVPFHQLDAYFYTHNTGLQNQDVLFVRHGLHGSPRALIDPNVLSRDGSVAVGYEMPSWNAKLLAYSTQKSGSEWQTWHVRDVSTGGDLPDTVRWSRFSSAAWAPDDSGFVYERYPQPAAGKEFESALREHAVYFHRLGSAQNKDELIYYRPDHKNWLYEFKITDDRRFGILTVRTSDSKNTRIAYFDTTDPWRTVHELLWKNDAQWTFVGNAGAVFFFTTTQNAPNSKVVAVDVNHAGQPRTLVPEKPYQLQSAYNVGHRLILSYLVDARSLVRVYDEGGKFVREVDLPGIGAAAGFGGSREDRTTFYAFTGYTMPSRVYAYDLATGKSQVYYEARVDFDASHYVSKEVFYTSKDGTRVPMILSYRKGLALDGNNPTLLYGYGGFGIPQTPRYGGSIATWMQLGGIYAVPNIRGGSEYGEAWHRAGMLGKKQNVFDDFIAAAEYLIAQKYTSTPKLAIKGDSNGGLL
ncbi:MAG TPA: prolyl oligopeptidase family serine peptidase, partial [Candidatus Baltobacteraceae bacterium]|nr:prolyl oligopeptidase family serine peptidase [Candidatus Baltobacteraceae bacterium]